MGDLTRLIDESSVAGNPLRCQQLDERVWSLGSRCFQESLSREYAEGCSDRAGIVELHAEKGYQEQKLNREVNQCCMNMILEQMISPGRGS